MTAPDAVPLISRADLFGNPVKSHAQISPDGVYISWLAPLNGVMNLFIAPRADLSHMRSLPNKKSRPVPGYAWAKDSRHLLLYKDFQGDENWHILAVNIETAAIRDLTPYEGVMAMIARFSDKHPGEVLITHNKRDPKSLICSGSRSSAALDCGAVSGRASWRSRGTDGPRRTRRLNRSNS